MVKKKQDYIAEPTDTRFNKPMSEPIEEYFLKSLGNKEVLTSKELFNATEDNVDIKTEVKFEEVFILNNMIHMDNLLKKRRLTPVFHKYLIQYMRLKISLDRKSRAEFVDMNREKTKTDDILDVQSKIGNIINTKR